MLYDVVPILVVDAALNVPLYVLPPTSLDHPLDETATVLVLAEVVDVTLEDSSEVVGVGAGELDDLLDNVVAVDVG
eukprot:CAMPEP_0118665954 /NCGR_PEP_ID=MMETSP0785-20121206/18931_1 /TAXON_ID=91992 /ORGANISM="Bolidomonas pacifica, Strain CCMP 1866" /LENGTH=75 /DNA_ID=CAMNT_0006560181 /DNA_START=233 /DNA_END=460 /DNA_ORIENTATION=+